MGLPENNKSATQLTNSILRIRVFDIDIFLTCSLRDLRGTIYIAKFKLRTLVRRGTVDQPEQKRTPASVLMTTGTRSDADLGHRTTGDFVGLDAHSEAAGCVMMVSRITKTRIPG